MASYYHPLLFDADRFERESTKAHDDTALLDLVGTCMLDDDAFGWALEESDFATDYIGTRVDVHGCNMGSIVENVASALGGSPEANEVLSLLAHITVRTGRLRDYPPLIGYLHRAEIERIVRGLETFTLPDKWQERDRTVLIGMLSIASNRGAGILYTIG